VTVLDVMPAKTTTSGFQGYLYIFGLPDKERLRGPRKTQSGLQHARVGARQGRLRVDSSGSVVVPRTAGIGASEPFGKARLKVLDRQIVWVSNGRSGLDKRCSPTGEINPERAAGGSYSAVS
jgi:hypothetical protein